MNKIFKICFNRKRGAVMVASEAAKSQRKSKVRGCVAATVVLGQLAAGAFAEELPFIQAINRNQTVVRKSGTYEYANIDKGCKYTLGNSKSEYSFLTHSSVDAIAGIAVLRGVGSNNQNGSIATINGKSLSVDVTPSAKNNEAKDYAFGIYVATANKRDKDRPSQLFINSENTTIVAKADQHLGVNGVKSEHEVGIAAMSWGQVQVNGNITITAADAILSRGYAVVDINSSREKTVKITGNIDFNFDQKTSGTTVDPKISDGMAV